MAIYCGIGYKHLIIRQLVIPGIQMVLWGSDQYPITLELKKELTPGLYTGPYTKYVMLKRIGNRKSPIYPPIWTPLKQLSYTQILMLKYNNPPL